MSLRQKINACKLRFTNNFVIRDYFWFQYTRKFFNLFRIDGEDATNFRGKKDRSLQFVKMLEDIGFEEMSSDFPCPHTIEELVEQRRHHYFYVSFTFKMYSVNWGNLHLDDGAQNKIPNYVKKYKL